MQCTLAAPAVPTVRPQSAATFANIQKGVPFFQRTAHSFPGARISIPLLSVASTLFAARRKLTPAFPITPGLFLRPFTQERKSSPVFSCACARFCRNGGIPQKFVPQIDGQHSGLSVGQRASKAPEAQCHEQDVKLQGEAREHRARPQPPFATRALYSLFGLLCIRPSAKLRALNRLRTLWKNHPGGGAQLKRSRPARTLPPKAFLWQRQPSSATIAAMPTEQTAAGHDGWDKMTTTR